MKELADIRPIIEQYAKHDWILRRLMLSSASTAALAPEIASLNVEVELAECGREGMWFSRRTMAGREAWELRRLSGSPFALVAVLEDSLSEEDRADVLTAVESRMFDGSHPEPTSH
ncbi:MAG: hypothetical protein PSX80_08955 [bacterium]|nr:hypothetical protein [bacterium]